MASVQNAIKGLAALFRIGDLKDTLLNHLDKVSCGSAFSHHGFQHNTPNPGLLINGHGTIGFPLTENDFARIIAANSSQPESSHFKTISRRSYTAFWAVK